MLEWVERYWSKVAVRGEDECWEWTGGRGGGGYGVFRVDGPSAYAHRLSWKLATGSIPEDKCVCHTCDNPACVNPSHLFLASHVENVRDRDEKGRSARGAKNGNAKLTRDKVREIRRLYASGKHTQETLGQQFGVTDAQVSRIVNRRYWGWLDQEAR